MPLLKLVALSVLFRRSSRDRNDESINEKIGIMKYIKYRMNLMNIIFQTFTLIPNVEKNMTIFEVVR